MSVAVGLGLMDFPFAGGADYWRWVDLCEAGGVDSIAFAAVPKNPRMPAQATHTM